ncbi:hypothetical protein [Dactylosporangium sp. CA-233914]|uniref:hypothetical protein n=1 Tax=Dactylosporangium sp. CA-233914 TaxID=3239934 RepID=UPI003D8FCFDD
MTVFSAHPDRQPDIFIEEGVHRGVPVEDALLAGQGLPGWAGVQAAVVCDDGLLRGEAVPQVPPVADLHLSPGALPDRL